MRRSELSIRRARVSDLEAIVAMQAASLRGLGTAFYSPEDIEAFLREVGTFDPALLAEGTYIVVEAAGEIVAGAGWSGGRPHYADHLSQGGESLASATVRCVFVHPGWARRGIARSLTCLVESEAAIRSGCTRLELLASLPGVPLYRALGYREVAARELKLPSGRRLRTVHMVKDLEDDARAA